MPRDKEPRLKTLTRLLSLTLLLAVSCAAPAPRSTPPPVGAATHTLPTPTPQPTPAILPTPVDWADWDFPGTNLALKKRVRVSRAAYGFGGPAAVDGSLRTRWSAGAGPLQWIEIDLGQAYDIGAIVLIPGQHNPGVTVHHVLGKAPLMADFRLLHTFESTLSDSPLLVQPSPYPWRGIRYIRIETTFSPVAVSWKEIGILQAE